MSLFSKFNKSKRKDKRVIELYNEAINRVKIDNNKGRYSFFSNQYVRPLLTNAYNQNDYDNLKELYDIVDEWDRNCNLPFECGFYLEELCKDPNNCIAIHRADLGEYKYDNEFPVNENLLSILQLGLQNMGHKNVGANIGLPSPSLTTTPLASFTGFINLIASYKNNNTIIIFNFPSEYVNTDAELKDNSCTKYIYDYHNDIPYIKPEYIEFVIIKNENGLDYYASRDEIFETLSRHVSL